MALSCRKKLAASLRGITFNYHGEFYCLNCLHSCAAKSKTESHKCLCENKDFYNVIMPSEDTKILEFNQYKNLIKQNKDLHNVTMPSEDIKILEFDQYKKSDKATFIYADLKCVMGKIDRCKQNAENSSTTKVSIFHQVSQCLQYLHLEA